MFGVAFALPLLVLPIAASPLSRPWMFALATLPVPLAVAVAMFQRRLYDVQLAVSRTLTYVALSAVLAGIYALVVVGVGVLLQDRGAAVAAAGRRGRGGGRLRAAPRDAPGRRQPDDLRPMVEPRRRCSPTRADGSRTPPTHPACSSR